MSTIEVLKPVPLTREITGIDDYGNKMKNILRETGGKITEDTFNEIKELEKKTIEYVIDDDLKGKIILETAQMTEDMKKHIELKGKMYINNDLKLWQKKVIVNKFLNFLKRRFGKPFTEVILTNKSNFYTTSYLGQCHHFIECMSLENIYWPPTMFDRNPYGSLVARIYLDETSYIEFHNIERTKTVTFSFSFDIVGNTFCLEYQYPKDDEKELERDREQEEEYEKKVKLEI